MHSDIPRKSEDFVGNPDGTSSHQFLLLILLPNLKEIRSHLSELRHRLVTRQLRNPALEPSTDLRKVATDSGDHILIRDHRIRRLSALGQIRRLRLGLRTSRIGDLRSRRRLGRWSEERGDAPKLAS
ncbi:hypothetical protein TorRG33x02_033070 [Trema orientale]|uniref:Uncharacterized protein n=1 Tax=Trema orientale TaxID=63057 RepID=A0A2P5FS96_TREOI|nr:hypothetical protein TorRG33x02_033070 [Trema orientale]